MNKILVLGGAEAQVPLIEAAKEEGYYVILCDSRTSSPGVALADKHYLVNTADLDAVMDVAKKEEIKGVVSNSESAMINVAAVSTALGLVGNPVEAVEKLLSKNKFRQLQQDLGVFSPKSVEFDDLTKSEDVVKTFKFPVIIKPSECSGTRGTTVINQFDWHAVERAFLECSSLSRDNKVTIEEYVEMPSFDVIEGEVFVCNGEYIWDGLFTTKRSRDAMMIPMTSIFPAVLSETKKNKVQEVTQAILCGAGVKHGEYNIECYFTKEHEIFLIEINARQGGNGMPQMVKKHCEIDMYKLLVTTSMGDNSYWNSLRQGERKKYYITRQVVFGHKEGLYTGISINDDVKCYVTNIRFTHQKNVKLMPAQNATDCLAWVDCRFEDRKTQLYYANRMEEIIVPIIEDN